MQKFQYEKLIPNYIDRRSLNNNVLNLLLSIFSFHKNWNLHTVVPCKQMNYTGINFFVLKVLYNAQLGRNKTKIDSTNEVNQNYIEYTFPNTKGQIPINKPSGNFST